MLESIKFTPIYFSFWLALSYFCSFPKSLSPKSKNTLLGYLVALFHSTLSIILSIICLSSTSGVSYTQPDIPFQHFVINVLPIQNTISYLTYDLLIGVYLKDIDKKMIAHHFFGIIGGAAVLLEGTASSSGIAALLMTETTSPMWQMKNIFRLLGKEESKYAQVNDAVFSLLFLMIRPFFTGILLYNMFVARFNFIILMNGFALYALGLVWSYSIICIIRVKKFKKEAGAFERFRDNKFAVAAALAWFTVALPYVIGTVNEWRYIHIIIKGFIIV